MSKKQTTKQTAKQQPATSIKVDCKLSKQHKVLMKTLYKGNMPKEIRLVLGAPDQERYMMMHEVKKPGGYDGI